MKSFSINEKNRIKILLMWINSLGQASIALYLPSLIIIAHDLSISPTEVKQTITAFLIGFGISPMLFGPLSDRYGRKPILLISLFLSCVGYTINLFADNIYIFIFARILQGLGGGGILVSGRSIMRDVFIDRELASASSYLSMGFAIGFGLTPSIGGYLAHYWGWKANFILLLIIGMVLLVTIWVLLPETLLNKQSKGPITKFVSQTIIDYFAILRNYKFINYLLGGLFAYGVVMSYNIMTPFLLQKNFNISETNYGYLAILMGFSYYTAASINKKLVLKFGMNLIFNFGYLLIIIAGIAIILLNTIFKSNLFFLIIPMMVAIFGQALIFSNTISGALHQFPSSSGGKASAIYSSLQMLIISVLSAIMATLPNNTAIFIGVTVLILGILTWVILVKLKP